jgi:hypothetical protein
MFLQISMESFSGNPSTLGLVVEQQYLNSIAQKGSACSWLALNPMKTIMFEGNIRRFFSNIP